MISKTISNPKRLFLIDGIGAVLSAFSLGVILVKFESVFGMPRHILYFLAALACVFAVYSLSCHFLIKQNWKPFLKAIAIVNLLYCFTTIGMVVYFFQILTTLGITYFFLELVIIVVLASIELKAVAKKNENNYSMV